MSRVARLVTGAVVTVTVVLAVAVPARAISELKRYEIAPPIALKALDGTRVSTKDMRGSPVVLVFGELYNKNTLAALKELEKLVASDDLKGVKVGLYLIVTQNVPAAELRQTQQKAEVKATVLHDPARGAFASYGVLVLPSVVVLDGKGHICSAVSGYPLAFGDVMADALQYALGRMSREQYEAARSAPPPESEDAEKLRGRRLAALAYQLFRRGAVELALERYEQAVGLDPNYLPSRIGLARCLIKLNRLGQAGEQLEGALKASPKSIEANLTMAYVEILRGGDEMKSAEHRLSLILTHSPHNAEAHYLVGLVYEAHKHAEKALAEYKKAAELLLEMRDR